MAYTNDHVHKETCTRVVCDDCANAGAVEFEIVHLSEGPIPFQKRPWCWYPRYGGKCDDCGKEC